MPKNWRGTATVPSGDRRRVPSGAAPTTTRRARTTPWAAQAGLPRRSRSARARQSGLKWHIDRAFRLVIILHEFLGTVPFGCYQEGGQLACKSCGWLCDHTSPPRDADNGEVVPTLPACGCSRLAAPLDVKARRHDARLASWRLRHGATRLSTSGCPCTSSSSSSSSSSSPSLSESSSSRASGSVNLSSPISLSSLIALIRFQPAFNERRNYHTERQIVRRLVCTRVASSAGACAARLPARAPCHSAPPVGSHQRGRAPCARAVSMCTLAARAPPPNAARRRRWVVRVCLRCAGTGHGRDT